MKTKKRKTAADPPTPSPQKKRLNLRDFYVDLDDNLIPKEEADQDKSNSRKLFDGAQYHHSQHCQREKQSSPQVNGQLNETSPRKQQRHKNRNNSAESKSSTIKMLEGQLSHLTSTPKKPGRKLPDPEWLDRFPAVKPFDDSVYGTPRRNKTLPTTSKYFTQRTSYQKSPQKSQDPSPVLQRSRKSATPRICPLPNSSVSHDVRSEVTTSGTSFLKFVKNEFIFRFCRAKVLDRIGG